MDWKDGNIWVGIYTDIRIVQLVYSLLTKDLAVRNVCMQKIVQLNHVLNEL